MELRKDTRALQMNQRFRASKEVGKVRNITRRVTTDPNFFDILDIAQDESPGASDV